MNQQRYRLVFDAQRGMLVAVPEHARGHGKGSSRVRRAVQATARTLYRFVMAAVLGGSGLFASGAWAAPPIPRAASFNLANPLPLRSTQASQRAGDSGGFVISTPNGQTLQIDQSTHQAIINWQSFNVGQGYTVKFVQPDATGSTLNKVWDADPSVILGRISANGEVILQNSNGILFGPTARVETGRFVATALAISEEAYRRGFRQVGRDLSVTALDGVAFFEGTEAQRNAFVSLERGAEIRTAAGGDVLIFAPRVVNEGRIETPGGQTVLGAGQAAYMVASQNEAMRGMIVAMKPYANPTGDTDLNTVTQAEAGSYTTRNGETVTDSAGAQGLVTRINAIVAERGSINLVAETIRQNGVLEATTAVKGENGAIVLTAMAGLGTPRLNEIPNTAPSAAGKASQLGTVELGRGSITRVMPDTSDTTQLDAERYNASLIRVEGRNIVARSGATVYAPAGTVELAATEDPVRSQVTGGGAEGISTADASRIVIESGATLSVAGLRDVAVDGSRNQISGKLFQIELADAPAQKNGALYREEIFFDARSTPTIANVSGFYNGIARTAAEKSTTGGTLSIQGDGAIAVDAGAKLDVSGGSVKYTGATIKTSIVRKGDVWVGIDKASKEITYDELGNSKTRTDAGQAMFRTEQVAGYVEGHDAGTLSIAARRVYQAGDIQGSTVSGRYQQGRTAGQAASAAALILGREQGNSAGSWPLRRVVLDASAPSPRPDALFADPAAAAFDDIISPTLTLSTAALQGAGVGRLTVWAGDTIVQTASSALNLGPRGALKLRANEVTLEGRVSAPGGTIDVVTSGTTAGNTQGDITLGSTARLDVAGQWVDGRYRAAQAPLQAAINGGTVTLSAAADLSAAAGAVVDASGGAWRDNSGASRGTAGTVTLGVNDGANAGSGYLGQFDWHATLRGFDFASGGTLAVTGLQGLTLDGTQANAVFTPAFFGQQGFGRVTLKTQGDALITGGFTADLQLHNWVQNAGNTTDADGRFATAMVNPNAVQRGAVSLTLDASRATTDNPAYRGSDVTMDAGTRITTEAGGTLKFSAGRNMIIGGELSAPGGTIDLSIVGSRGGDLLPNTTTPAERIGFDPAQALWIADTARLSVAGTHETVTDFKQRTTGKVYGGGTINLKAQRGYVIAGQGAVLDLDGDATTLSTSGAVAPQLVSRSAGTLNISSPEGVVLDATIEARAPNAQADGGTLNLAVTTGGADTYTTATATGKAYPTTPRRIVLGQDDTPAPAVNPGDDLNAALGNGEARVSVARLQAAGFDSVKLKADDQIVLQAGTRLALDRSLTLDTRSLVAEGAGARQLSAAYVALGDQREGLVLPRETAPVATTGSATLQVEAGLIEVYGKSSLQGFDQVALAATRDAAGGHTRQDGEIRLIGTARGVSSGNTGALAGQLAFGGTLTLTSGQTYATTMSRFALSGLDGVSTLTTVAPAGGSTSAAPLSALGTLALTADTVNLGGVIRQPYGSVSVTADTLNLQPGAVLSVSGDGQAVPVGTTVNGRQWLYQAGGSKVPTSVSATTGLLDGLPVDKAITLQAGTLNADAGAQLSAAGGGDLQAWEFIAGVGGSADVLAKAGLYAVVPGYHYDYAPYDTEVAHSSGSTVQAGQQITITMAGAGLAPGTYTLLPARYALLPGAFVVSVAATQSATPLTAALHNSDGSAVVTGSIGAVGSSAGSDAGTNILVTPQSTLFKQAQYDLTSVNALLAGNAAKLDEPTPTLPGDGGRVSVSATLPFNWQALADLQARNGGRAGTLDLSAADGRMAIVDDVAAAQGRYGDGWSLVSAAALSASQAGSLLVGGTRTETDGVTTLATTSREVRLDTLQQTISAGETLLTGRDAVTLGAGSTLVSTGTATQAMRSIALDGDGALAIVSDQLGTVVQRTGASGATGRLDVADGATLQGPAVRLAGTAGMTLADTAQVKTDDLGLSAQRLAIGTPVAAVDTNTTVLQGQLLASVQQVKRLELGAQSGIDFHGTQAFSVQQLTLDAPTLRGLGNAGDTVTLQAQEVSLRNTSGNAADPAAAGQSQLIVQATPPLRDTHTGGLTIGASRGNGTQQLAFGGATLASTGDIVFQGDGQLNSQGDLTLRAERVTATTGATHGAQATGHTLRIEAVSGGHTLDEITGVGATLAFGAQHIEQAGRVEALGGVVDFHATGTAGQDSLVFATGSTTSAAGFTVASGDGHSAHGNAGEIHATADQGHVVMAGTFDVSAPGDARAGLLQVAAPQGHVDLHDGAVLKGAAAKADSAQGRFALDAGTLAHNGTESDALDPLAAALNSGGFHDEIDLRLRHTAAATLGGDAALKARRVTVAVDQGSLTVDGKVDARSAAGGVVQLYAAQDVTLNGSIDAASTRAGANGGDVLLSSTTGSVNLGTAASIDASGDDAQDGRIVLRSQRQATGGAKVTLASGFNSATQLNAADIVVEAVKTYTGYDTLVQGNSSGTQLGQQTIRDDSAAFAAASAHWLASQGLASDARVHLDSGVEIMATGDFTVRDDWDLWATNRASVTNITLRSAGHLTIQGSISDGIATEERVIASVSELLSADEQQLANDIIHNPDDSSYRLNGVEVIQTGRAGSYRFVAGSDQTAANLMATRAGAADLSMTAGHAVRTTTGSIELAAGRDVRLEASNYGDNATVVVTGGVSAKIDASQQNALNNGLFTPDLQFGGFTTLPGFAVDTRMLAQFTSQGGRLEITASRDVVGAPTAQATSAWFNHIGQSNTDQEMAWWSSLDTFRQGAASFGGGNVRVIAGRDVNNFSIAAPTSAMSHASAAVVEAGQARPNDLVIENGGDILVQAGRNVLGGVYVLGRGTGLIDAAGQITTGASGTSGLPDQAPLLALMQGQWQLQGRDGVTIDGVYNPTLMSNAARVTDGYAANYLTYSADSALYVKSATGDVTWRSSPPGTYFTTLRSSGPADGQGSTLGNDADLTVYAPAGAKVEAFSGNVRLQLPRSLALYGTAASRLEMHAGGDIVLTNTSSSAAFSTITQGAVLDLPNALASSNRGASTEPSPVYLHADGSIHFTGISGDQGVSLMTSRATQLDAGGDILNLYFEGQNLLDTDVTSFTAGGNIVQGLSGNGAVNYRVTVGGPGDVVLQAGRQIDLGVSKGVETIGNANNAALPAQGANLTITAGAKGTLNVDTFVQTYLTPGTSTTSVQARAEALADEYIRRVGEATIRDALGLEPAALRAQLVTRYTAHLTLTTGQDSAAVTQRRHDLVRAVRAALHLPALADSELDGAYDGALAQFRTLTSATQAAFAQAQLRQQFAQAFLAEGKPYATLWQQTTAALGADPARYDGVAFQRVQRRVLFEELKTAGTWASLVSANAKDLRTQLYAMGFGTLDLAGQGQSFSFAGDLDLVASGVQSKQGGDLTLQAPGGQINVGLPGVAAKDDFSTSAGLRGAVAYGQADLNALAQGDFQVNSQKAFIVGQGDLTVWSSQGDIDAGRGSNTAVSSPPPTPRSTEYGTVFVLPDTTVGSGIGILKPAAGNAEGDIGLYAPNGEVRALDAMIRAPGRITLAAEVVRGADNIVGGAVVGAPVAVPAVSIAAPTSSTSQTEAQAAGTTAASGGQRNEARDRNSLLTVELLGLGLDPAAAGDNSEETCDEEKDRDCRKKPAPGR